MIGFVNQNLDDLWIDPIDYQPELAEAVEILSSAGLHVSIYNHQLCVLESQLWPFTRKSISDWKNIYLDDCEECLMKEHCGGFFQSSLRKHSDYIKPFIEATEQIMVHDCSTNLLRRAEVL